VRWLLLVVLTLGCSSTPTDPVDAAVDGADAFFEDTADDGVADDTSFDDTSSASCFTSGDPCFVNADCCSNNCIGVSGTDGGAIVQSCQ
jgi:hypothetical protein